MTEHARLIVVDDEQPQLNALCSILEEHGFEVTACSSPMEAIAKYQATTYDLLLTDLKMPNISGIDLVAHLRNLDPQLCAVLMTGHSTVQSAVDAMRSGVLDYVLKPFKFSEILPVVQRCLHVRKLRMENQRLITELTASNRQLSEMNAELDAFAGRASHDLNSVIHLIQGYASRLTSRSPDNFTDDEWKYLQRIRQTSERASTVVTDLLSFARLGQASLDIQPVDLNAIATQAKILTELMADGPPAAWDMAELPTVPGDASLLEQVFMNLFSNALKFSSQRETPRIELGYRDEGSHHVVWIRDNGSGFNPEHQDRLFKPFQRLHTQSEFEGNGLGLAHVKRIIERHQGQIWAESNPDDGACFYLKFSKTLQLTPGVQSLPPLPPPPPARPEPDKRPIPDLTLALQRIGGYLGKIGGWAIEYTPNRHVYWSDEIWRILDAEPGEQAAPTFETGLLLYPEPYQARVAQALMDCVQQGTVMDLEAQIRTFQNRLIWVQLRAEAVFDEQGVLQRIQGCMQDITDRRMAMTTLRRINKALQAQNHINMALPNFTRVEQVFDEICTQTAATGEIPLVWVVQKDPVRGGLRVVSRAGKHQDIIDTIMANTNVCFQNEWLDTLRRREIVLCLDITNNPHAQGWVGLAKSRGFSSFAIIPLHLRDKLIAGVIYFGEGVAAFDKDLVDLLHAISKNRSISLENLTNQIERSATLERLKLLETCVERFNDMVVITEAEPVVADGPRIRWVNQAYYQRTGFTPDEVIGKTPRILQGPLTQRDALQRIHAALSNWQPVREELINYTKAGELMWLDVDIVPIADEKGWFTHWVAILRDITERKRAESALNATLHRFRSLANATSDCIWDWDLNTDEVWWSDGIQTLFGLNHTQLDSTPKSWSDRVHADDRRRVLDRIKQILTGSDDFWKDEYRFARADGSWAEVVDRGFVIRDDAGKALRMIGGITDMTHILEVTRRSKSQLVKMNLLNEITHAIGKRLDLDSIYKVVVNALEKDLPSDFCFMASHLPEARAMTVHCLSNNTKTMACAVGLQEGHDVPVRGTLMEMAAQGQFVYEPDMVNTSCPVAQSLQSSCGLNSVVIVPLKKGDTVLGVMVTARKAVHGFENDDMSFLIQLAEHVALALHQAELLRELQVAYAELKQTQALVLQQERLGALAEMAGGIAHDINNAISPAALYVESLLNAEQQLSPKGRKQLETVQIAIDDVANTVERMGRFARSREEEHHLEPVDVNLVCREVLELTRAKWETTPRKNGIHIELHTALGNNLPALGASEAELREAMANLIFNAVDAMPQGGLLTVRTELRREGRQDLVVIEVQDTGVGMSDETRRRCIEPFFTTKGQRGTGLGLAMVYGIVKRFHGRLLIQSTPEQGSTVSMVFEYHPQARFKTQTVQPSVLDTAPGRPLDILLVDDDLSVLEAVTDMLHDMGHRVTAVNNGHAALEALAVSLEHAEPVDVLITDLGMPDMDGKELARQVKKMDPRIHTLLLTGWGKQMNTNHERVPHVDLILAKPPKAVDIRSALNVLVHSSPV
ncbi:response regulator [Limnobacter humi]|uniref:histidine kinase n=1 Tax=Limnobacter humi TaxID=1778671 RepID=A0ABT1WJP8_9BURK|nr:ATP-binding protein [Limnobacter humi]MCQ8897703.1 response regulator [Limnobacter humi]